MSVKFQTLAAVSTKIKIFRKVMSCSLVDRYISVKVTCYIHFQARKWM